MTRGRFARLCIEIDLDQPLKPIIQVGRSKQHVEYENITNICFKCGKINHRESNCPTDSAHPVDVASAPKAIPTKDSTDYGPWMIAS
ncbi:hypothetical protein MKX03_029299, partial [Papaver bracteatum]